MRILLTLRKKVDIDTHFQGIDNNGVEYVCKDVCGHVYRILIDCDYDSLTSIRNIRHLITARCENGKILDEVIKERKEQEDRHKNKKKRNDTLRNRSGH